MSKIKLSIILVIAAIAFLAVGVLSENSVDELQSTVWQVNDSPKKLEFTKKRIYVEASDKSYDYQLSHENDLEIKNGLYAGRYQVKKDTKNFRLVPLNKQQAEIKLTRENN